jgi:DNA polymerase III delta prime subunit
MDFSDEDLEFPCPHYVLFEPLNDSETIKFVERYQKKFGEFCEFEEIDACTTFSSDVFSVRFTSWISEIPKKSSTRLRVIIIWHAEFLTFACQQMLRRQLEQRSFKNRVWFHVENPASVQSAILSRCITKRMPTNIRTPQYKYD